MKNLRGVLVGAAAILVTAVFFLVPFAFIFLTASKDKTESALLAFSWPKNFVLLQNLADAFAARDYLMVIAFINSVITEAMAGRASGSMMLRITSSLLAPSTSAAW